MYKVHYLLIFLYHFMGKRAKEFELVLLPPRLGIPAYRWFYTSLRDGILQGRLRAGVRLPSTRDLASQYGLARGTIVNAFEQLKSEGYVQGSVGSGTYVARVLPERLLQVSPRPTKTIGSGRKRAHAVSDYGQRVQLFGGYDKGPARAFRANLPAVELFPIAVWTRITSHCLRSVSRQELTGCDPLGYLPLRQAIADYLNRSRGVRCAPEQVAIVSGVQQALDLTARLLLNPGDKVCMEDPGYPGASLVFRALGASVQGVPIDEEGMVVRRLPERGARLIYITPGHQFPLGTTMTLSRRLELLRWASKSGALIFEDDYDSEYRYSGRPVPALQGLDERDSVVYAGSFSKVLFPALRAGYVVLPRKLVNHFEAMLSLTSRHAPVLEQLVLNEFIREGHFGRHLRRMREVYAERLSVLLEAVRKKLAGSMEISDVEAGLQTTAWLRGGLKAKAVAVAAAKRGVEVIPVGRYSRGKRALEGLQLGFAALDPKEIRRGVEELAIALEEQHRGRDEG